MPLPNSTIIGAGSSQETEYSLPGSPELRQIKHALLGNWVDVRPNLRPRYWQVWWEIFLCLLMMISGYITHLFLTARFGNVIGLEIGAVFAAWIGFWLNALLTFGHEAAHYNLSPSHARNDLLADWTIWLFPLACLFLSALFLLPARPLDGAVCVLTVITIRLDIF